MSETPWSPAYRRLTIGLMMTIVGVAFEALAVATIMPATVDDLGGIDLYGWVFSAFLLANLVGIVIAGGEADRRGPAVPYLVGMVLFAAGLLVSGLAPTMPVLLAGRALQGFGGGGIISMAYVAIGRVYPASARPRMLALQSSAWVVPGLIGPALTGIIADAAGWRWVFLGLVPLPLLSAALATPALRQVPKGARGNQNARRVVAALGLAVGAGLLLFSLGRDTLLQVVPLAGAGIALSFPALIRLFPPGTIRAAPGLPAAIAVMSLLNFGFFGVHAFVPLALVDVRDRSVAFAGLALTAATISWTSGSWLQARFSPRTSRRRLVRLGLTGVGLGATGAALVLIPAVPAELGPLLWGSAGLGMGLAYSTLSLTVLETSPKGQEGESAASLQLANVLGGGLGTGVGGAIVGVLGANGGDLRLAVGIQDAVMIGVILLALAIAAGLPTWSSPESVAGGV